MGNGDGTFKTGVSYTVGDNPRSLALGDLDGDGDLDLILADYSRAVTILLGNGDGSFTAGSVNIAGITVSAIAVGDLDGDGDIDITTGNRYADGVAVLINQNPVNSNTCAGDLNFDGDVEGSDLVIWVNSQPQISLSAFTPDFGKTNCYD